jgi:sulfatase modifying factor 1
MSSFDRRQLIAASTAGLSAIVSSHAIAQGLAGKKAGDARKIADMAMVWCPPGRFRMGSPPNEPERRSYEGPVEVTLTRGFWIGKFPVTQAEWLRFMEAPPGTMNVGEGPNFPIYKMNHPEAELLADRITTREKAAGRLPSGWAFRLPTEAQWEYACRAGTTTATAFGDSLSSFQANFRGDKPYNGAPVGPVLERTSTVGSYPANPWGIHDMHGNVFEWCRDWFHDRLPGGTDPDLHSAETNATVNRTGDTSRARRGGCWSDEGWPCRSGFRLRYEPERRHEHIGMRLVLVQT